MLSTIRETVEIQDGGLLQLHVKDFRPHTKVNVVAIVEISDDSLEPAEFNGAIAEAKGLLKGRVSDPVDWQRKLRDEWDSRLIRETAV